MNAGEYATGNSEVLLELADFLREINSPFPPQRSWCRPCTRGWRASGTGSPPCSHRRQHRHRQTVGIHEAHYDADGKPRAISVNPVTSSFDSTEELRAALTQMLASLDQPVLHYHDF
jgi:hypothetical protein